MSNKNKRKPQKRGPSRLARKRALAYQNADIVEGIRYKEPFKPIKRHRGKTMKEIIILMIINSGEIPTDLYMLLNITCGTFRAYISDLYDDDLARLKKNDKIHTYLLSQRGKYTMKEHRPFINTPNDITSRKRHIRLARLNAFFWGLGISVFRHENLPAENIANNIEAQKTLRFYNSCYLKPAVTEYTENIKRSKSFGLLTGNQKNYMVFYEPLGTEFYYEEELYKITVSRFIGAEVNEMLLVLDSYSHAAYWLYFLFNYTEYFCGDQPSRLFEKVKILVMDEDAQNALYVLINEDHLEKQIDAEFNLGTGDDNYEYLLTLDVYKLLYFIMHSKDNPQETMNIITTPYLTDIVSNMVKGTGIKLFSMSSENWEKYCQE